jgi:hypothetical protein
LNFHDDKALSYVEEYKIWSKAANCGLLLIDEKLFVEKFLRVIPDKLLY